MVGHYTIIADLGDGVVIQKELNVAVNVVPESPIGIIALMGSTLAALGGFIVLRRRQGNSEHSIGDLGI